MTKLDEALQQAIGRIPSCLAAGYVDLETGLLLGIRTVDSHPRPVMELLAAATADLFDGPNVRLIEQLFRRIRRSPEDGRNYFQEVVVNSAHLIHVFLRSEHQQQVACFVCRLDADVNEVVAGAERAMPELAAAL